MTAIIDEHEATAIAEEAGVECEIFATAPLPNETAPDRPATIDLPLPWIGALSNPRLGPMVAVNDSGYLVALCTAGNLLRGCRIWWSNTLEHR